MTDSENGGVVNEPKYVQNAGFFGNNLPGSHDSVRVTCEQRKKKKKKNKFIYYIFFRRFYEIQGHAQLRINNQRDSRANNNEL